MLRAEKILKEQLERRAFLMKETFERPPTTFEAFQNQLGRYQELSLEIARMEKLLRGIEDEDQP